MTSCEEREYVLGTGDDEFDRLSFQHGVWRDECERAWDDAGFGAGMHILDVGCGPGFVARDLSRRLGPEGKITAVDVSQRFIDAIRSQTPGPASASITPLLCDVTEGDSALPREVDGIYARWLFCFVQNPRQLGQRLADRLKSGAALVVHDYFNWPAIHLEPGGGEWARFKRAVLDSARLTGGDLDIMSKLPNWLAEEGLVVESMRPFVRLARPGDDVWRWFRLYLNNFGRRMVDIELWTADEHLAMERAMDERERLPACFFLSPPQMVLVARKP